MVFGLDVGTDLFGMKQNTRLEFATVPQLSELIIAAEGHFDKEARVRRPADVPDLPFKVQSMQCYDDVLLRWVDLYASTQLHPGSQVWLFQPESIYHGEAPGDIPTAKYAPETWLGSPARDRAVMEAGIRDPVMSEKLRSVFHQFDPVGRGREVPYSVVGEYFRRHDVPWTSAHVGELYGRHGDMSYGDWAAFADRHPHVVDSLYFRNRGICADRPYHSVAQAEAELAAKRTQREVELRTYYSSYAAEKARIEGEYHSRRMVEGAAAATAAAAAQQYYYSPLPPQYL